jgi:hypothetical protein
LARFTRIGLLKTYGTLEDFGFLAWFVDTLNFFGLLAFMGALCVA